LCGPLCGFTGFALIRSQRFDLARLMLYRTFQQIDIRLGRIKTRLKLVAHRISTFIISPSICH
jgi:hypothetical protein